MVCSHLDHKSPVGPKLNVNADELLKELQGIETADQLNLPKDNQHNESEDTDELKSIVRKLKQDQRLRCS